MHGKGSAIWHSYGSNYATGNNWLYINPGANGGAWGSTDHCEDSKGTVSGVSFVDYPVAVECQARARAIMEGEATVGARALIFCRTLTFWCAPDCLATWMAISICFSFVAILRTKPKTVSTLSRLSRS